MKTRVGYVSRFDVCAAYNLWLQDNHSGMGSREYLRLCKLQRYYRPSRSEERVGGLSADALALYMALDGFGVAP
jgi:hypothetical protein